MTQMKGEKRAKELAQDVPKPQGAASLEAQAYVFDRLDNARIQRSQALKEFDGMPFDDDYERNREAVFSFLRPKINEGDVRVNSGTAEKKIELILNELLAMNFQPEVRAYDRYNVELVDLSIEMGDLVQATNEQEKDEDTYQELYLDLLSQRGAFFIEETKPCYPYGGGKPFYIKRKRRLSPLQVYLGDITLPLYRLQEQPYIVIYDRMPYDEAAAYFEGNKAWADVRPGNATHDGYSQWFKYRFLDIGENDVEIVTYMSAADGERQTVCNGVLMEEIGTPLGAGYPIGAATVKGIPDFAYGKPPIASAKFLQSLKDEMVVNFVRKMRQSIEPPLGVPQGKVFSRDIFNPGTMTQGLNANTFTPLIDNPGVTNSDYQMMQMVTQMVDEFIGQSTLQTQPGSAHPTATQIIELQKEGLKMIGLAVLAASRLKREATYLRIGSLYELYFKPESFAVKGDKLEAKYRKFETKNGKNRFGDTIHKFVVLADRELEEKEVRGLKEKEEEMTKRYGHDVRYSYLNVARLKLIPLTFNVVVSPEPRNSGAFDKILFQDQLTQASQIAQMTGKQLNADKVVQDFERTWKSRGLFSTVAGAPAEGAEQEGEQLLQKINALGGQPASTQPPAVGSPIAQQMKTATRALAQ